MSATKRVKLGLKLQFNLKRSIKLRVDGTVRELHSTVNTDENVLLSSDFKSENISLLEKDQL